MWLLLGGLALAGLRADLGTATQGSPDAALVCTSARTAWTVLGSVLRPTAEGASAEELERVFRPGGADALFEEGSRLSVAWWRAGGEVQIGFDTTKSAEQVARAFAALDTTDRAEVAQGPEGWHVRSGEQQREVRVADGWARIFQGSPPGDAVRVLPTLLVEAMPEDPGCVAVMHMADPKVGDLDLGVHLPFTQGEPTTFALAGGAVEAFGGMVPRPGEPMDVHTVETPQALAVIGLGMDGIDFSAFLAGRDLRRARRLQNLFPVTSGTTVAILAFEPTPVLAAALPLPERFSARKVTRRAKRLLKRQDIPVERVDATHLTMRAGAAPVYFAGHRGRLLLATEPAALSSMEKEKGDAWVDSRVGELAKEYPFVLSTRVLPRGQGLPPEILDEPATIGLDLKPGILTGVVFLPFTLEELIQRTREPAPAPEEPNSRLWTE